MRGISTAMADISSHGGRDVGGLCVKFLSHQLNPSSLPSHYDKFYI
jgi:hypothetical protein